MKVVILIRESIKNNKIDTKIYNKTDQKDNKDEMNGKEKNGKKEEILINNNTWYNNNNTNNNSVHNHTIDDNIIAQNKNYHLKNM